MCCQNRKAAVLCHHCHVGRPFEPGLRNRDIVVIIIITIIIVRCSHHHPGHATRTKFTPSREMMTGQGELTSRVTCHHCSDSERVIISSLTQSRGGHRARPPRLRLQRILLEIRCVGDNLDSWTQMCGCDCACRCAATRGGGPASRWPD